MSKKLLLIILVINITSNLQSAESKEKGSKSSKLPPCRACKVFVESFRKGIVKTEKGKYEGGDTAWEEEKLGSYATSEIRLVEIQENLCGDVNDGKDECYALHEEYDSEIEDWWFHKQNSHPDLYKYFCIETFKRCCPDLHFGPDCTPCEGYPENVCSNNGKCKGAGTRKGNGDCQCDVGYTKDKCDSCAENFYESYRDEKKLLCSKCHTACDGSCTKAGASGCVSCKSGWLMSEDKGCLDINECASPNTPCQANQFCVNNEGSYKCLDCDKSCAGCTGDGPDMCRECALGYSLIDNMCTDNDQENRKRHVFLTRYLTYLGMAVATGIILNKNIYLAAIVGFAVAVYISISEYVLNSPPTPETDNLAAKLLNTH